VGAQDADDAEAAATEAVVPKTAAPETAEPQTVPKATPQTAPKTAEPKAAPKPSGQPNINLKMPKIQGAKTVNAVINTVIGYVSQIGAVFGKTAGIRIGGTSGSAIVMLVVAKLLEDKAPSWLKWLLYLSGGTMVAGSGANITQLVMGLLS